MNKPLLIIICDFLLISLLSLARFDQQAPAEPDESELTEVDEVQGAQDMMEALKMALQEERQSRDVLTRELQSMQDSLQNKETVLAEKEIRIESIENNLENVERKASQLQRDRTMLKQQYDDTQKNVAFLQEQYVSVKNEAKQLQQNLSTSTVQANDSRARLETIQSELQVRRQEAKQMQGKMDALEKERKAAEEQKFQLALELKQSQTAEVIIREYYDAAKDEISVARADVEYSREQLAGAKEEVAVVREEKERVQDHADALAVGVGNLTAKSEEIREDIRSNTPLAANTIFNDFVENRITTRFFAARSGLFGQAINKESETNSVLVRDGDTIYALYHVEGTPFRIWQGESNWEQLTGVVNRSQKAYSVALMSCIEADPRILVGPVGAKQADVLGGKIYNLAENPFKFQEAVLVGAQNGYYGEAEFKLDPQNPNYVKMEKQAFRKLVGKFSPSRGDLVFSKTGELLGIMVNDTHCAVLKSIETTTKFKFGNNVLSEQTGGIMASQKFIMNSLPIHLQ